MQRNPLLVPALAVAASGLLWGIWWIPLRWLEASGLSGDRAGLALYLAAMVVLAPAMLLRRERLRAGGGKLWLIGLFSGLAFTAWNHALIAGDVVRVTLLFYLMPVWGTAFAALYFREAVRPMRVASIVLGLAGAAVVLGIGAGLPVPGSLAEWMALGSGVLFALAATYSRQASAVQALEKTFLSSLFAAIAAAGLLLVVPDPPNGADLTLPTLAVPLAVCLFWQVLVTWLLLWGATRLDAGRVGILLLLEVLGAAVSAALLADEPFGWREAIGCVLIIGAGLTEAFDETRRSRGLRAAV